jgi:hypothetical protein
MQAEMEASLTGLTEAHHRRTEQFKVLARFSSFQFYGKLLFHVYIS